jgi:hypothetical protein
MGVAAGSTVPLLAALRAFGAVWEGHTATHPGKLRRARVMNPSAVLDAESGDEATDATTAEAVFAVLAAEADEEPEADNALDAKGGFNAGAGIGT